MVPIGWTVDLPSKDVSWQDQVAEELEVHATGEDFLVRYFFQKKEAKRLWCFRWNFVHFGHKAELRLDFDIIESYAEGLPLFEVTYLKPDKYTIKLIRIQ